MKVDVKYFKLVKQNFNPSDMHGEPNLDVWGGEFDKGSPITFEIDRPSGLYRVSPYNGSEHKNSEWKPIPAKLQNILDELRSEFEWEF